MYNNFMQVKGKVHGSQKKKGTVDMDDESVTHHVKKMISRMEEAFEADQESYAQAKPAFRKLQLSDEIYKELRKNPIQEKFLELGGCEILSHWLDRLDAKDESSYPNVNLV